jgi:heme a synthase
MNPTTRPVRSEPRLSTPDDQTSALAARRRAHLAAWFWTGAGMTLLILFIGGITRLTQSGLSIVDWQPIVGVIPPVTEAQWIDAFERYREFPEYQRLRQGMTLSEFKFIFFWEYLHRVVARLIGIVFLVPFLFFWAKGYLTRPLMKRALVLFALGGLQGFMGWYMVQSGLVDQPRVSHYRLAVHLSIAFAIFGCCVWFALDLMRRSPALSIAADTRRIMTAGLAVVGALLGLQIFWGALVAGLKAGYFFNTFPLMEGSLFPTFAWSMEPRILNAVQNAIAVQWLHRVIGTILGVTAIAFFLRVRALRPDARSSRLNVALLLLIVGQYLLGVLTLIHAVPISLGVAHQALAMVLFGVWLAWLHHTRNLQPA